MTAEADALMHTLNAQRQHVLGILDGLSEESLRRALLPTGWTPVGLVRHLTLDVERFWFRAVMAGEPVDLDDDTNAWYVAADESARDVLALYRSEIELANEIILASSPDAAPARWPDELFPDFRMHDLRELMLHVIAETACHAGHLDAARELIDRRTWMILTDTVPSEAEDAP